MHYARMTTLPASQDMNSVIHITVNGQTRQFPRETTISQLVATLALTGKRIAVECNGEIVPRSQHESVLLNEGDQLEIVVAVGGG